MERAADSNRRLWQRVLAIAPEELDRPVPGKGHSLAVMLHGSAQHVLYHAGKIMLLKKLV